MCFTCQENWKENQRLGEEAASDHFDQLGCPQDALVRKIASVQIACNNNPVLSISMSQCWPSQSAILQ